MLYNRTVDLNAIPSASSSEAGRKVLKAASVTTEVIPPVKYRHPWQLMITVESENVIYDIMIYDIV